MELNKNKTHPRMNIDDKVKKIPISVPIGTLTNGGHSHHFDTLNIAT